MTRLIGLFFLSMILINARVLALDSLIANGDFESPKEGEKPDGWSLPAGVTWEKDGDNRFMRLESPQAGANVMVYRAVSITPDIKAFEFKYKGRFENIKRGKESWFDGRIIMNFKDAAKETVQPSPKPPSFNGSSTGW